MSTSSCHRQVCTSATDTNRPLNLKKSRSDDTAVACLLLQTAIFANWLKLTYVLVLHHGALLKDSFAFQNYLWFPKTIMLIPSLSQWVLASQPDNLWCSPPHPRFLCVFFALRVHVLLTYTPWACEANCLNIPINSHHLCLLTYTFHINNHLSGSLWFTRSHHDRTSICPYVSCSLLAQCRWTSSILLGMFTFTNNFSMNKTWKNC